MDLGQTSLICAHPFNSPNPASGTSLTTDSLPTHPPPLENGTPPLHGTPPQWPPPPPLMITHTLMATPLPPLWPPPLNDNRPHKWQTTPSQPAPSLIPCPCCCAGQWTHNFEVLIPKPPPQFPSATALQGPTGLSPQDVRSSDVACASLQLLFLLLRQLKRISTALAKQKPHGQAFKDKCSGLVSKEVTALKGSFQQLVAFLGMCSSLLYRPSSTPPPLPLLPLSPPNQPPPAD